MSQIAGETFNFASALIDTLIASNRGDADAFTYNARRYSYQDVAALMNRAGNMLKGLGVEAGATVLLLLPPSPAFVASLLGGIKAGAVPLVGAPLDSGMLEPCVAATRPAAAIVHENRLNDAERALGGIRHDAVVIAGAQTHGYPSFVEQARAQSSWLAAEEVRGAAPALGFWTGSAMQTVSHAELAAFVAGSGQLPDAAIGAILRAFAEGTQATL